MSCYVNAEELTLTLKSAYTGNFEKYKELSAVIESVMSLDMESEAKIHAIWFYAGYVNAAAYKESRLQTEDWSNGIYERLHTFLEPYISGQESFDYDMLQQKIKDFFPSKVIEVEDLSLDDQIINAINDIPRLTDDQVILDADKIINMILENVNAIETGAAVLDEQYAGVIGYLNQLKEKLASRTNQPTTTINRINRLINDRQKLNQEALQYKRLRDAEQIGQYNGRPLYILRKNNGQIFEIYRDDKTGVYRYFNPGNVTHDAEVVIVPNDQIYQFYNKNNLAIHDKTGAILRIQQDELATGLVIADRVNVDDDKVTTHERISESLPTDQKFYSVVRITASRYNQAANAKRRSRMLQLFPGIRRTIETAERPAQADYVANTNEPILSYGRLVEDDFTVTVTNHDGSLSFDLEPVANLTIVYPDNTTELFDPQRQDHLEMLRKKMQLRSPSGKYVFLTDDDVNTLIKGIVTYNQFKAEVLNLLETEPNPDIRSIFYKYYDLTNSIRSAEFLRDNEKESSLQQYIDANNGRLPVKLQRYDAQGNKVGEPEDAKIPIIVRKMKSGAWEIDQSVLPPNTKLIAKDGKEYNSIIEYSKTNTRDERGNLIDIPTWVANSGFNKTRKALYVTFVPSAVNPQNLIPVLQPLVYEPQATGSDVVNLFTTMMYAFNNADFVSNKEILANWNNNFWGFNFASEKNIRPDIIISEQKGGNKRYAIRFQMKHDPNKNTEEEVKAFNEYFSKHLVKIDPIIVTALNDIVNRILRETNKSIPANATLAEVSKLASEASAQLGSENKLVKDLQVKLKEFSTLVQDQYNGVLQQYDKDVQAGTVKADLLTENTRKYLLFDGDVLKLYGRQAKSDPLSAYYKLKTQSQKALTLTLRDPFKLIILPSKKKTEVAVDMAPVVVPKPNDVIEDPGVMATPVSVPQADDIIPESNDPFKLVQALEAFITLSPEEFQKEIDTMKALLPKAFKFTKEGFEGLDVDGDALGFLRGLFIHLNDALRAKGVVYHEGFHGVFRNILSTNDQKYYLKRVETVLGGYATDGKGKYITVNGKKVYADDFRKERRYVHLSDEQIKYLIYEEYLADSFADFMESGKAPKTWMERLFAYLKMLLNFFKKQGDIENLFYDISLGKYKNAQIIERPSNVETLYSIKDYKGLPTVTIDSTNNKTRSYQTIESHIVSEVARRMVGEMAALKATYPTVKTEELYAKAKEIVLKEYNIQSLIDQAPQHKVAIENAYNNHYNAAKWLLGQFHESNMSLKFLNYTNDTVNDNIVIDKDKYPDILSVSRNTSEQFKKAVISDFNSVDIDTDTIEQQLEDESSTENTEDEKGETFNDVSFVSAAPGEGSAEFRKMFKYITYDYLDPRFGITRKRTINPNTIFNTIRKITANLIDKRAIVPRILQEIDNLDTIIDDYNVNIRPQLGNAYAIPIDYAQMIELRDSLQAVYNRLNEITNIENGFPTKNLHVFIQFANTFSTIDVKLLEVQLSTIGTIEQDGTKRVVEQNYKVSDIVIGNDLNRIRQDLRNSINRLNAESPESQANLTQEAEKIRQLASLLEPSRIAELKDRFTTNTGKFNDAAFKNYVNELYISIAKLNIDVPYFVLNTIMAYQVFAIFVQAEAAQNKVLKADDFFESNSTYRSILRNNQSYFSQFENLGYTTLGFAIANAIIAKVNAASSGFVTTEQLQKALGRLSEPYINAVGELLLKYDPTLAASVTKNANGDKVNKYVKPTPAYVMLLKLHQNPDIAVGLQDYLTNYFDGFQEYFLDNPLFDLSKPENKLFLENLSVAAFAGFSQSIKIDSQKTIDNDPSTFRSIDDKSYALAMLGMFVNRTIRNIPGQDEKLVTFKRILTQYEATSTSIVIDTKYKKYVDAAAKSIRNNEGVSLFAEDLMSVARQEYNLILKNFKEEADPQTRGKQYKDYNTEGGQRRGFTFNVLRDFFNVANVASADPNDNRSQRTGLRENLIEEAKKGTNWETLMETNPEMAAQLIQQLELFGREQFAIFQNTLDDIGIAEEDYPNHPDYLSTPIGRKQMRADMFFNNWIGGLQVNQLFDGPIAVGIKNFADFFKRQKSGAAAGENTDNPFRLESAGSSTYRAAVVKEIIMYIDGNDLTKPMRSTPYNAAGEENIAVKPFDGQSVNTLQRRMKIADSQGQLDSDAMQILRRMRYLMESSKQYADGIVELRKRNIYFNSLKTVTAAGFQYFKQSEHTLLRKDVSMLRSDLEKDIAYRQLEELYNRADMYESFLERGFDNTIEDPETGEQVSIEEMYMATMSTIHSYFVPLKGRESLHVLLNSMEMDRIEQLMDPNASKRATVKPLDINLIDLESGEGYLDLRSALEEAPNDLTYIQVETGGISKKVTQGIQQKLLIMAQLNPSDPRYKNIQKDIENYRNGLPAAVKAQSTRIMRMLNVSDKAVVGKIYTAIADGLRSQGASSNMLQFFELNPDGTPIYNPSNPLIANTIVYYYFSLFNNGVFGKKIAGNKFYHVSPYGYKVLTTASGEVITHDEYRKNPNRYKNAKTRYPSIVKEEYEETDPVTGKKEKKTRYVAEVIVPKELKYMDQIFVEKYLSEFFATRIPTEGRRSMIVAKIVDYIDEAYGNSIIVPFQLHMLAGSDFDIDSLYAHMKDSYYAPSGDRILYGSYSYYKNRYGMSDDEAKFIEYLVYISNDEILKSMISEEKRRINSQSGFKAEAARNFGNAFGGKTKEYFYDNAKLLEKEETEDDAELIDDFKKLIATFNVLNQLKGSELPTTPEELKKYIKDTGTNPVVNVTLNQIVQSKINILSDPEVYRTSFADPTNTADKAAEIYKDYVERRGMSEAELYNKQNLYTPTALLVARSINSQSKDSLGIAASFNKGVSMLATIEAVLTEPIGYIYDESTPGQSRQISTDRIVDQAVKLVGGAIGLFADAPKNPYPGPLNLNNITTPVMGAMYSIGWPQGAAIMFQSLPIVKQLLDDYTRRYGSSYASIGTYTKTLKRFLSEEFADRLNNEELYKLGIVVDTKKGPIVNPKAYKLKWNDRITADTPEQKQTGVIPISNFGFEITDANNNPVSRNVEDFVILNEFLNYMSWGNEISFKYTKLTDVMKSLRPDQDVFDMLLNTFKELKERPEESRLTQQSIDMLWKAYPVLDASYEVLKQMDAISKKVMIERTSFMKGLTALFANIPGLDASQVKTDIKAFLMLQLQNAMMQENPKGLMSQLYLDQLDAENFLNGQVIEDYVYLKIKFPNNAFLQNINSVTDNNGKRVLELTSRTDDDVMFADFMALMTNTPDIKARAFRIAYHGMIKSGLQRGKGSFYQLLPAVLSRPMSELMNKLQDQLVELDNVIMKKYKAIGKDESGAYIMEQDAYDEYTQKINEILLLNFKGRTLADIISDAISKIISYRVLNNESAIQKSRTSVEWVNKRYRKADTDQITNEDFVRIIKSVLGAYAGNVITDAGIRKQLNLEQAYFIGATEVDLFVPTGNTLKINIPSDVAQDNKALAVLASVGIRYTQEGKYSFPLYKYNIYGQMMVLKKIDGAPIGSAFVDTLARTEFSGNTDRLDLVGTEAEYGIVTKQGSNKISPLAFSEREGAVINNIVNGLQQVQSVRVPALPEMFRLNRAQNAMYFHYPINNTRPASQKDRQYQLIDNSIVTIGNVQGKYQYVNGQLYMTDKAGVPPAVQDAESMTLFAQSVGAANFEELKGKEEFADFFASKNAIYVYNLNNGGITVELPKVEQQVLSNSIKPSVKDLSRWSDLSNATDPYTDNGIVVTRIKNTEEHFGNPFIGSQRRDKNNNLVKSKVDNVTVFNTIDEADQAYRDWLMGVKHQNIQPSRREWILKQINEGKLDGKTLLYYKPMEVTNNDGTIIKGGYHSHADTLAEIVEELRSKPTPPTTAVKPGVPELFESNPELANTVYEALGFIGNLNKLKVQDMKTKVSNIADTLENTKKELLDTIKNSTIVDTHKEVMSIVVEGIFSISGSNPLIQDDTNTYKGYNPKKFTDYINYKLGDRFNEKQLRNIISNNNANLLENIFLKHKLALLASEEGVSELPENLAELELAKVTPQQKQQAQQLYSQYLDTIFPDSKVKEVLYHMTSIAGKKGIEEKGRFLKPGEEGYQKRDYATTGGIYFTDNNNYDEDTEMYGSPITGAYGSAYVSAILNIKNPLIDLNRSFGDISKVELKDHDGFVGTNESKEIGVLEPEQIHILGSKQDIEGFKEFVATPRATPTNPLVEAGVKPTDMSGNAAKDIQMAEESTQFIGYQSGNAAISSTNSYRLAWGNKANTGNYRATDVVMVSATGAFRGVTKEEITATFIGKYQPLLDKAIAAGASFRVGNQYAKGNYGDELVANYLKHNGYAEEKLAGYSRWTKVVTPVAGTVRPGVEISSNSKGLAAALTNPTELAKKKGNLKQSYPVYHQWLDETGEVQEGIFDDVEQAYQRFKDPTEQQTKPDIANSKNYRLMVELIKSKLEAYKVLVDGITEQGGSPWILSCTHQPTKKNTVWETGGKNWFILALNEAYLSTQSGIKPQPPATEPVENKIDKYKYYGAFYEIVTQNGVGVDVVGYKGKAAAKKKLLDAYNNNPNVDPQTGISFRDVKPTHQAPVQPPASANTFSYTFSNGLTIPVSFELNDEQKIALQELEAFINGKESIITLSGAAGTGKSTVISMLAQFLKKEFQPVKYTSPTHRANAVTKMMNPQARVYTLHALFGLSPQLRLDTEFYDLKQLQFAAQNKPKIESGDVLIIDESSMISDGLYEFIQSAVFDKNLKVIYVGDEAQLQPVKQATKSKAFTNPTQKVVRLTKVERTGDNAILRESVGIRSGKDWSYQTSLNNKGEGVIYLTDTKNTLKVIHSLFSAQANMDNKLYFRILSATNKGVDSVNTIVRETLYQDKASEQLVPGEIIMGYDNFERDYTTGQYQLYNGGDYQVVSVEPATKSIKDQDQSFSIDETYKGYRVVLQNVLDTQVKPYTLFVLDKSEDIDKVEKYAQYIQYLNMTGSKLMKSGDRVGAAKYFSKAEKASSTMASMKDYQKFDKISNDYKTILRKTMDYGYAHTIHKSQGGTYDNVLILADTINPPFDPQTIQQLKYVAISRAKKMAYIRTSNPLANRPDNKDIDSIQMEKEAVEVIRQKEEESKSCNLPE